MDPGDYTTSRLLTQSLILSAMQADRSGGKGAAWEAVTDLAALVDIYCFFDRATVLGRDVNVHLGSSSLLSEALADFIVTEYVSEDDANRVRTAASAHVRAFQSGETRGSNRRIESLRTEALRQLLQEVRDDES